MKSTLLPPNQFIIKLTSPSVYGVFLNSIMNTKPTASVLVTYGKKYTVWKRFLSFSIELSARDMTSARDVESGTVIMTSRNVFLSACKKYGSRRTYE